MRSRTGLTALLILFAATASEAQRGPAMGPSMGGPSMVMPPPPAPPGPAPMQAPVFVQPMPTLGPLQQPTFVQPAVPTASPFRGSMGIQPVPVQTGADPAKEPASSFAAEAHGDLNSDGEHGTFEMHGRVDGCSSPGCSSVSGQAGMFEEKELE